MSHRVWIEAETPGQIPSGEWVEGLWIRGDLWVHFRGETRKIAAEEKSFGGGKTGRAKEDVQAPMPGKVTKVLCKEGQVVSEGDVLVVMEAMKMEYSLKADVSGKVVKVECQAGDQVTLGKVLIRLKSE